MTHEEMVEEALKRYRDEDEVHQLGGKFRGLEGRYKDATPDEICTIPPINKRASWYDPEEDTLSVWGRGLVLVYRKGKWARKVGEPAESQPIINNSYSII